MYGKLINGELITPPENLTLEDGTIIKNFNRSISKMLEYGFKPVVEAVPGFNVNTQYCNFVGYVDKEQTIRCIYEVENIELSELEIQNKDTKKAMEFLNIDLQEQIQTLPAEQALEVVSLYPEWCNNVEYVVDYKIKYCDELYRVLQTHISQDAWTPDVSPSLFAKVIVGEEEILEWVQPDSTNPYMSGDRVIFEGTIYESTIDNNIWSPVEYPAGWKVIE